MNFHQAFFGTCRSRSYSELDPSRGKHFVGFWAPDLRREQGFQRDKPVDKWRPHVESSNMDRLLVESAPGLGPRTIGSIAAFFGENKMQVDSNCAVLSFSAPDQRQLYVRFRVFAEDIDATLLRTSFDGGPGFNVDISMIDSGIVVKVHGAEWAEGAEPVKVEVRDTDVLSGWIWAKVFVDADKGSVELSCRNDYGSDAYSDSAALPGGLYKAPETAKHFIGWDGVKDRENKNRISIMDFGYGSSIALRPPHPE